VVSRQTSQTHLFVRLDVRLGIDVTTSIGEIHLPQYVTSLSLVGRQSKLIVTDYDFGSSSLLYSTAHVFFAGTIGDRDILFLYGDASQDHEAAIRLTGIPNPLRRHPLVSAQSNFDGSAHTVISFLSGVEGLVTVWDSSTQLVLYSDTETAGTFWSPPIAHGHDRFLNYWSFGTNMSILVGGPYLVREAQIHGEQLALRGDLEKDVRLTVIAQPEITSILWNDIPIPLSPTLSADVSSIGAFVGDLALFRDGDGVSPVSLPRLSHWKFAWSLPEIYSNFSDSHWTSANHTKTNNPWGPVYGDGTVLYGCDYGL
jgi:hypothetical protein